MRDVQKAAEHLDHLEKLADFIAAVVDSPAALKKTLAAMKAHAESIIQASDAARANAQDAAKLREGLDEGLARLASGLADLQSGRESLAQAQSHFQEVTAAREADFVAREKALVAGLADLQSATESLNARRAKIMDDEEAARRMRDEAEAMAAAARAKLDAMQAMLVGDR